MESEISLSRRERVSASPKNAPDHDEFRSNPSTSISPLAIYRNSEIAMLRGIDIDART